MSKIIISVQIYSSYKRPRQTFLETQIKSPKQ